MTEIKIGAPWPKDCPKNAILKRNWPTIRVYRCGSTGLIELDEENTKLAIEREQEFDRQEAAKFALFHTMRTRLLTDEEMVEVLKYGDSLNTPCNGSWNTEEKRRELDYAYQLQERYRALAQRQSGNFCSHCGHKLEDKA